MFAYCPCLFYTSLIRPKQKATWEKRFILFTYPNHSPSKGRNSKLAYCLAQPALLIYPSGPCPEMVPPTVAGISYIHYQPRKCLWTSLMRAIPPLNSLFPDDLSCYQVDKKNNQHTYQNCLKEKCLPSDLIMWPFELGVEYRRESHVQVPNGRRCCCN